MTEQQQSLHELQHIKNMMERSSRFISLSGLSGVAAGICALAGAWLAHDYVLGRKDLMISNDGNFPLPLRTDYSIIFNTWLFWIAAGTFATALISAFFFTAIKSRKQGIPLWGNAAKRLLINVSIPLAAGGIFLFKLLHYGTFGLVAPGCLIFYGLALINASKYTFGEVRWLGVGQLLLGLISLGFTGYGIYFWALGFGVLHILYGVLMWQRYERNSE
jgi:hypothetical protein